LRDLPHPVSSQGGVGRILNSDGGKARVRIWDGPTRLSHGLIVILVAALWWTGETDQLDLHRDAGSILLGVVIFRLIWGFIGASTARFSDFMRGPRAIATYVGDLIRGRTERAVIGHNPLGGWSVAAMLALLASELTLGLFTVDVDGAQPGPLAKFISFDQGRAVAQWHQWAFNALLALIGLHLAAVVFYAVIKRDNLVGPMISGARRQAGDVAPMTPAPWWRLAVAVAAAAVLAALIVRG
jgi:cytochrome b